MYESNGFEIELIQDSPALAREYLVQGSDHRELLNFVIEFEREKYNIYLDSIWFEYDKVMGELEIIKEFATSIEGTIVSEDTHKWFRVILEDGNINVYDGDIVFGHSVYTNNHTAAIDRHLLMYHHDIIVTLDMPGLLDIPAEAEKFEDDILLLLDKYHASGKVHNGITGNTTTSGSMPVK